MGFRRGGTRPGRATGQGRGRGRRRFTRRYDGRVFQPLTSSNGMTLALSLTRFNYHPHQQFNRHSPQQHLQQQLP